VKAEIAKLIKFNTAATDEIIAIVPKNAAVADDDASGSRAVSIKEEA